MRQVAISVLMAQAGSFVPASNARIGVADRIYTRVGASDNLSQGQSTFMLEMHEVANILRGATRKSLVVVDEVGRGTSTYDGLAIAWAVAEHLHDIVGCRSMFATHYHELCELAATRPGVQNFNVAAKEYRNTVVFLRKLGPGGANRSYGVAVAKLAGVPETVLERARDLLRELESGSALPSGVHALMRPRDSSGRAQLDLFGGATAAGDPRHAAAIEILADVDPNHLTPMQALEIIARLKAALENDA
jgi:DNA mismatch repair protein MutS